MARRTRGAAKTPSVGTSLKLAKIFEKAEAQVEKSTGLGFFSMSEYEKKFGIPGYIPTGLWDLDMMLPHNDDRTQFGIPRGRITEIHGQSSSFKSTICYRLAANVISQGGFVYWFSTEMDFNQSYAYKIGAELGVSTAEMDRGLKARPVENVKDLFNTMKSLVKGLEESTSEISKVPVLFILDSLAAFLSGADYEKMDSDLKKDEGNEQVMGSNAGELHRLFKFFMNSLAKTGATLLVTNQMRANLKSNGKGKTWLPAHDNTIRYYASLRICLTAWNYHGGGSKAPTREGTEMAWGRICKAQIYKVRGEMTLGGETELVFQYNHGFDFYQSALVAMHMAAVSKLSKGEFIIDEPEESPLRVFNGKHDSSELKALMAKHLEDLPDLMEEVMKRSPRTLEDMRGS